MGTRKSSGQHVFSQVPKAEIQRSTFDRSHGIKTTFNAGLLIPIFVDEALPGDTMNMQMTAFARIATLLNPIMDNVYLDVHFFAVPNRLLWDDWERFNGAQDDPADSTDFLVPIVDTGLGIASQSMLDYMGVPIMVPDLEVSALFPRAMNLIWNEWYRDQNLQDSVVTNTGAGPDLLADYALPLPRGKRHDYFTSCLPWPQKGPSVEIPLGDTAPVILNPTLGVVQQIRDLNDHTLELSVNVDTTVTGALADGAGGAVVLDPGGAMLADLSAATAATINSLREAFQIQRLYERDARGGTRYTEILKSHFGVTSPDQRLQRPEFLGGGTIPVLLKAVEATTPIGLASQAAFGIAQGGGIGFTKSFTEHCVLIGLVSARADLNYQQGLDRQWSRQTRFDFYWPALSHLGEQEVLNKEIQAQGSDTPGWDDTVFGYQERFAEYRYKPNMITGLFRSTAAAPLDVWHLAQELDEPVLNEEFIVEDPPFDRVIALPGQPVFLLDGFMKYKCARPMPTYGVPGMIDHF